MSITAGLVKELREKTGVGMMECKKALVETSGDITEAEKLLRKKGAAKAAKKADRATGEGVVLARIDDAQQLGVLVEVNCETDFAARNEEFQALANQFAEHVANDVKADAGTGQELSGDTVASQGRTVEELLQSAVQKIGENMQFKRFARFESKGAVASYVHTGGKIGVLVDITASTPDAAQHEDVRQLARDVAMHVAAAAPRYTRRDEVPAALLDEEREIAREQAIKAGKPENIVDKIAEGKLGKFYSEICLVEQPYVRDPDVTIQKLVDGVGKQVGADLTVERFTRFVLGE